MVDGSTGTAREGDDVAWWKRAVIYQIAVPMFADADGDGVGDLDGVCRHLDHVRDLGADVVWLSPFYPSPMEDFGYDITDHRDVDPLFGDLDALDGLLDRCHERGLRVLLDWVPNHTSDQHPWFVDARYSRDAERRDWYVFRDPAPDGGPPNNWVSLFGGPAWTLDEETGQYWLHSFLPSQPDVNWRNDDLRAAMLDVVRFWLDRGVDGFRIDVAHFIMKDPDLRDNPPADEQQYHKDLGAYDEQEHVHDKGHPDVHDVFRELRGILDGYDHDPVAVGEIHEYDLERWADYFGEGDELHMPFNFVLLSVEWRGRAIREAISETQRVLPDFAWPCWALGNHDESRMATRYGPEFARVATALLLGMRGTPSIYNGDELGFTDRDVPGHRRRDPWGEHRPDLSRDVVRVPMAWDRSPTGGFSDADPAVWYLPPAPWAAERSVEALADDPASMLSLVRRLIEVRRATPALLLGTSQVPTEVDDAVVAVIREHEGQRVLVAGNTGSDPIDVAVDGVAGGTLLCSTDVERAGLGDHGLRLGPAEAVYVELADPT